ncbi:hypothetical protein [Nostoc sp.]
MQLWARSNLPISLMVAIALFQQHLVCPSRCAITRRKIKVT